MAWNFAITCQGLKEAIDRLTQLLDLEEARDLCTWILTNFAAMVAPWQFPQFTNDPPEDEQEIKAWADEIRQDESCPCHAVLNG